MKRNLFPLLGIAVVVAIAATGVFYGLFVGKISGAAPASGPNAAGVVVASRAVERGNVLTAADVRLVPATEPRPEGAFGSVEEVLGRTVTKAYAANDALTATGLASAKGAGGLVIPKGMRAISIRVGDSTGLVPYLRAGNRIDVQSIQMQGSGEAVVRTMLSNVEVLNVHADLSPQPAPATVVNLLVPARDVERVALADSATKMRIVLRNAEDEELLPVTPAKAVPGKPGGAVASAVGPQVTFQVRMAAAAAETIREMSTRAGMVTNGAVRIGVLPAGWTADDLERNKSFRVLTTENVNSSQWQEVSLQAGGAEAKGEYDLRLRLTPRGAGNGSLNLRVRPELTLPQRGGLSSRRFSADLLVPDGQSVLVAGFERDAAAPALIEKLFRSPAAPPAGSELLMVVTPRTAAK
jgi:pilus assembly protein CpaB